MTLLRVLLQLVAIALLLPGLLMAAATGIELFLLLSGQVQPGQPMFLGDPAPTLGESARGLAIALGLLGAAYGLSRLARRRPRASAPR